VLNGTVTRLDLAITASTVTVNTETVIASGYTSEENDAALILGPTGLAYDPGDKLTSEAPERGLNFRVTGTPGCLTIGLASQRAGSITDQPSIIPRPAPRTRETGSPPALSRSEALVRETREPRVRIRLPPAERWYGVGGETSYQGVKR